MRLTQMVDFINRDVLPAPYERNIIYSHISDEFNLKRLRKELSSHSDIENNEEPDLFS
jgi:hypothetical protein